MGNDSVKVQPVWRQINDLRATFPGLIKTIGENALPLEQRFLDARKIIEPQELAMIAENYRRFGPELNRIGADVLAQNAQAQVAADLASIRGGGRELNDEVIALARRIDPEYYNQREFVTRELQQLVDDLRTPSASQQEEVARGLARTNPYDTSRSNSVMNALTFGQQGLAQKNLLGDTLARAAATLPALRSGVDPFQISTGRTAYAVTNPGGAQQPATDRALGGNSLNLGSGLFSAINQQARTNAGLAQQNNNTLLDNIGKGAGFIGDFIGGVTGLGGIGSIAGKK